MLLSVNWELRLKKIKKINVKIVEVVFTYQVSMACQPIRELENQ